jgi:hypothetical protein
MSSAAVTDPVVRAELARAVGALLPLAFAFAAILWRRDDEPRPEEREPEQRLPLFLATTDPDESARHDPGHDPRLVPRR